MSLAGRVALVTGAGRGIGQAIAERLASDGATVVVNDRDAEGARTVAEKLVADGGTAVARPLDLTDLEAATAMVQDVAAELGRLDILVNNAGVLGSGVPVVDMPLHEPAQVLLVNTIVPFALCKAAVPIMRAQGRGDIVVVSSGAARGLPPGGGAYNISKAGVEALALTLAKEEIKRGIRVNVVAPGVIDTPMAREVIRRSYGSDDMEALDGKTFFGRFGKPADIAAVVSFLVSDDGRHVVGQCIGVTGG